MMVYFPRRSRLLDVTCPTSNSSGTTASGTNVLRPDRLRRVLKAAAELRSQLVDTVYNLGLSGVLFTCALPVLKVTGAFNVISP